MPSISPESVGLMLGQEIFLDVGYNPGMRGIIQGFTRELVKLSSEALSKHRLEAAIDEAKHEAKENPPPSIANRSHGHSTSRDYLASGLIGAAAMPAVGLAGNAIARALRNRAVGRELAGAGLLRRRALRRQLEHGPLIGPHTKTPVMSYDDLAGRAVVGGLTGSGVQAVRDRLDADPH